MAIIDSDLVRMEELCLKRVKNMLKYNSKIVSDLVEDLRAIHQRTQAYHEAEVDRIKWLEECTDALVRTTVVPHTREAILRNIVDNIIYARVHE